MQQFLMDYSSGLSGDRDSYYCPFAVMQSQAGPEQSPGHGKICRTCGQGFVCHCETP